MNYVRIKYEWTYFLQELESERVKLMEDVQSNKKKMKELEDNLLYRLTSTKVMVNFSLLCSLINYYY